MVYNYIQLNVTYLYGEIMLDFGLYGISVVVFFFHSFLSLYLCNALSDKMRVPKIFSYIICVLNGLTAYFFVKSNYSNPMIFYIICSVGYLVQYSILFSGRFLGRVGVAFGSLLHLFVLRAIIIASTSLYYGTSMRDIYFNTDLLPWINVFSFATQIITLVLFIKIIPLKTIKVIINNKEFFNSLLLFIILLVIFMAYSSNLFLMEFFSVSLTSQVIFAACVVILFFYIVVLHFIKIFNLGLYKEHIEELEQRIEKERSLAAAVLNFATVVMEVNCMNDKIQLLLINSIEMSTGRLPGLVEFFGTRLRLFAHEEDSDKILSISTESLIEDFENGITEREIEYRSQKMEPAAEHLGVKSSGDEYFWFRMRVNTRVDEEANAIIALITIGEIHDEKEEVLALQSMTETDELTGLYNKKAFAKKVDEYLLSGGKGALYMFDIDNFKGINDNMGHSVGDDVLREVSVKIPSVFREIDIVGRIGGDEFVAFLKGTVDKSTITGKAKKICADIKKTYTAENKVSIQISSSIGIALAPKDGHSFDSLFSLADLAMYGSKSKGKDTYTMYEAGLIEGFKPQEREAYMRLKATQQDE